MFNDILLTRKELKQIANNVRITRHAFERMQEHMNKNITLKEVVNYIKNTPLAWKQSNGQYVVAVTEVSCFVLYKFKNSYSLVSYLRKSENNYSIIDKFIFEYKGVKKQWKDTERTRTP